MLLCTFQISLLFFLFFLFTFLNQIVQDACCSDYIKRLQPAGLHILRVFELPLTFPNPSTSLLGIEFAFSCRLLRCQSKFTMSVVATRTETPVVPYNSIPENHVDYSIHSSASRTASISSYRTNYSASTAPTTYSPSSPSSSYRQCDSVNSLPKLTEPIQRRLPHEVYEVIIHHLEELHKGQHQTGCTTCFQRDLHALALTCRSWEKAVRGPL